MAMCHGMRNLINVIFQICSSQSILNDETVASDNV